MSTKNCAYWVHYIYTYIYIYIYQCIQQSVTLSNKIYDILYISYHNFCLVVPWSEVERGPCDTTGSIPNSSAARSGAQNARKIHYQCVLIDGDQLSPRVQIMTHEKN